MHHFFEAITNTRGESLVGYFARVIDPETQGVVTIAADDNGTPIVTVSGVPNMAITDDAGNLSFFVAPGTYHLDLYQPDATTLLRRVSNYAMTSQKGDPGAPGDPGPPGNPGPAGNVAATLDQLKAAPTSNVSMIYDGALWFWTLGNFSARASDPTIAQANGIALTVGAWVRQTNAVIRPSMFGAKGDGATNDNAALRVMTAVVNAISGGVTIDGENKLYIVGAQTPATMAGQGYAFFPLNTMFFSGCTKRIKVQNMRMRYQGGEVLFFGSFDPVTKLPTPGISVNPDNRGDVGYCIIGFNCSGGLDTENVEIDGNIDGFKLGGFWGDTGYQLGHYGVYRESTPGRDVGTYCHHLGLDGFAIADPGSTTMSVARSVEMVGCRSDFNARQGLSIVGGKGHRISQSQFTNTGKGRFSTSPGAGIDLEAENAVNRDILIDNCLVANNTGVGIVADSGDSADIVVSSTSIYGTAGLAGSYSIWPNKPRMTFRNCRFSGQALANHGAASPGDVTRFEVCTFWTARYLNLQPFGTGLIDASTRATFTLCTFQAADTTISIGSSVGSAEFYSCSFVQNGSTAGATVQGRFYGENKFALTTGSNDFGATNSVNYGRLLYTGSGLGIVGINGEGVATTPPVFRNYRLGLDAGGAFVQQLTIAWNDPVAALNAIGPIDIIENSAPVLGKSSRHVVIGGVPQPVDIIGMKKVTGLTSGSTTADIVAALQAAGIAA